MEDGFYVLVASRRISDDRVSIRANDHRIAGAYSCEKRWFATGAIQTTKHEEADIGSHMIQNSVGFEDKICAPPEIGPKPIENLCQFRLA